MDWYSFPVRRPVTVAVVILGLLFLGLLYTGKINIEFFPRIDVPVISVMTLYPGAGPEEVEEAVTKPIEEAIGSIGNLKEISSTSAENLSSVIVRFEYGTNMDQAASNIREKLDRIKASLPTDARTPIVNKADPSDAPIMRMAITGTQDLRSLRTLADDVVKKDLEKIEGVASVRVTGGLQRQILISVDRDRLEAYRLSVQQVISAIRGENMNVPAGKIKSDRLEFGIRSVGEYGVIDEIQQISVGMAGNQPVYLRDIAAVTDTHRDVKTIARLNGTDCISIEIRKNTDANIVEVSRKILKAVDAINLKLPRGAKVVVAYDQAVFIERAVHNMKDTAYEAAVLAILVILLFLGSFRSTAVISVSIPVSVVTTFLVMYFSGLTINMITLTGLILGIGRIVDDSIVVLENIFRHMEEGKPPFAAAVEGTKEVGLAVLASTFTTISVFLPLFLVPGIAGQIFKPLSKTFASTLLVSLGVAVTAIPMMASRFIRVSSGEDSRSGFLKRHLKKWDILWRGFSDIYRTLLYWSLHHRPLVVLVALMALVAGVFLSAFIPKEMVGKWDRGDFQITVETPAGSSLKRTTEYVNNLEDLVRKEVPEMKLFLSDVGQSASGGMVITAGGFGEASNLGGLTVSLVEKEKRKRSQFQVMEYLRNFTDKMAGAQINVSELWRFSGAKPVEVVIKGHSMETLSNMGRELIPKIKEIKGLSNVDLNWRSGSPEYRIVIDRRKAASLGIGYPTLAATLRQLMSEDKVSTFREMGKEIDIVVRLPERQRRSIKDLMAVKILTPSGTSVPIGDIAEVRQGTGPSQISRRDRERTVAITGDLSGRPLSAVVEDIRRVMDSYPFPPGHYWQIAGEEKERMEVFDQLLFVLRLAILFVYVILAVQFESFVHPFTIMLAIPLELVGVFLALFITGTNLSMFGLLGVIMLTGIVVSNSILLVNYVIILRERGLPREEAILQAGPVRLRPIMMTASATVFAMIPLALGLRAGAEMFKPLAIGVMGGLITSTALTLLVVPVAYTLIDDLARKLSRAAFHSRHN